MDIKKRIERQEYTNNEIAKWLDNDNPSIFFLLIKTIVSNNIKDTTITDKLFSLSKRLKNENRVLGYYKIGHLAMSALLKLGMDSDVVFGTDLDQFEKEMTLKFLNDYEW
ncbi:hypothetical protein [Anaerocolumna jejuensis]|uniref:hypothetical protein n=1 Tax=Anaerocolumna jejuensis TaxID=259063 RepID=UPI003F7C8C5C